MRILYAGDSPVGGSANYLVGIFSSLRADFLHIPPSQSLRPALFRKRFDAVILSDFSHSRLLLASEKVLVKQVKDGTGLLMVGGWASFSGPRGGWKDSLVEACLPIRCLSRDDRVHLPGGAIIVPKIQHPMIQRLHVEKFPVICGLNEFLPKEKSCVLLTARKILAESLLRASPPRLRLDSKEYPLLVIHSQERTAALATDLAPHWCGGLVDWGRRRMRIRVKGNISIEIGDLYFRFVSVLLRWLGG